MQDRFEPCHKLEEWDCVYFEYSENIVTEERKKSNKYIIEAIG